jgi:hypothetical protein
LARPAGSKGVSREARAGDSSGVADRIFLVRIEQPDADGPWFNIAGLRRHAAHRQRFQIDHPLIGRVLDRLAARSNSAMPNKR